MKRPYRPAASANPGRSWPLGRNEESRFTVTRWGQTAKAFLPASNVLSSLISVTATPRGLACRTSSFSFIIGLAVGGRVVFPPPQSVLSSPAGRVCGDTVGSPLQRSDPVPATCQSSTSLSINPNKDAKGSPSWRRVPLLPGLLNGSVYWGYRFGRFGPATHFSLGKSPPLDRVQLTVVNSASKASVLQLELSSLLQKGAIEEIPQSDIERGFFSRRGTATWDLFWIYGVWIFPSTKGSSRCWRWKPSCLRSKKGTGLSLST